jgi:hypothetical protein
MLIRLSFQSSKTRWSVHGIFRTRCISSALTDAFSVSFAQIGCIFFHDDASDHDPELVILHPRSNSSHNSKYDCICGGRSSPEKRK